MATPLERQILSDFEAHLRESEDIPQQLVHELLTLAGGEKTPSTEALLGSIKKTVGDQPV